MTGVNQEEPRHQVATSPEEQSGEEVLSIGALSRATGIPVETLRTWERRYGFPLPERRTPGGHRLYAPDIVAQLALLQEAITRGYRPGQVITMEMAQLEKLLGVLEPEDDASTSPTMDEFEHRSVARQASKVSVEMSRRGSLEEQLEEWIALGRAHDSVALEAALGRQWFKHGATTFLQEYMAPLIREVGDRWASGELSVGEEHFISEQLRDFLVSQWRPMSRRTRFSTTYICANLPGERHTLALHMVASVLALHGYKVIFLGADLPLDELVEMSARARAQAICLSLSTAGEVEHKEAMLRELEAKLPKEVQLLLGGGGAQALRQEHMARGSKRLHVMNALPELERWLLSTSRA